MDDYQRNKLRKHLTDALTAWKDRHKDDVPTSHWMSRAADIPFICTFTSKDGQYIPFERDIQGREEDIRRMPAFDYEYHQFMELSRDERARIQIPDV